MATRAPSTLFDLPNWYKETPGARLSRVSGNPFRATSLPQIALPDAISRLSQVPQAPRYTGAVPDTSKLNPILERIKGEQAKIEPLKATLDELKTTITAQQKAIEDAITGQMGTWFKAWGTEHEAVARSNVRAGFNQGVDPKYVAGSSGPFYTAYTNARKEAIKAADQYKTALPAYNSSLAPYNAARTEYDEAFAPYKADIDAYNQSMTAYRSDYDANKVTYDAIKSEAAAAKSQYQGDIAATSLRRAAPVTEDIPVEQLIGRGMESTTSQQAGLDLYSDDLNTIMQARRAK